MDISRWHSDCIYVTRLTVATQAATNTTGTDHADTKTLHRRDPDCRHCCVCWHRICHPDHGYARYQRNRDLAHQHVDQLSEPCWNRRGERGFRGTFYLRGVRNHGDAVQHGIHVAVPDFYGDE